MGWKGHYGCSPSYNFAILLPPLNLDLFSVSHHTVLTRTCKQNLVGLIFERASDPFQHAPGMYTAGNVLRISHRLLFCVLLPEAKQHFLTLESVPNRRYGCSSCCSCCYGFQKMPKALLIRNGKVRNLAYTFMTSFPPGLLS